MNLVGIYDFSFAEYIYIRQNTDYEVTYSFFCCVRRFGFLRLSHK